MPLSPYSIVDHYIRPICSEFPLQTADDEHKLTDVLVKLLGQGRSLLATIQYTKMSGGWGNLKGGQPFKGDHTSV